MAAKQRRYIKHKRAVNVVDLPELKFHDHTVDGSAIAAGGVIVSDIINDISAGTLEQQRIGRKITIKNINWRYQLKLPILDDSALLESSEVMRLIFYQDKQCNGTPATAIQIMETVIGIHSFRKLANAGRFTILMDKVYVLNYQAVSHLANDTIAQAEVLIEDSFFKKVHIPIEFLGTSGAIRNVTSNNLGVLVITRSGTGSLTSKVRIRFTDN